MNIYKSVQVADAMQGSKNFKNEVDYFLKVFFRDKLPKDESEEIKKECSTCIEPIVIKLQWGICEIKFKSEVE